MGEWQCSACGEQFDGVAYETPDGRLLCRECSGGQGRKIRHGRPARVAGAGGKSVDAPRRRITSLGELRRAFESGDVVYPAVVEYAAALRRGEPIEVEVVDPDAVPAAARPAGREYGCHLCGAGISPAGVEKAAHWTGLGWRLFCPACAGHAEQYDPFAGEVSDG